MPNVSDRSRPRQSEALPPAVVVEQIDVRDGTSRRWGFQTNGRDWWSHGPEGRGAPIGGLPAALRASAALDPLPWCAMVISTSQHTKIVRAEIAERLVGRGDRSILETEWHESIEDFQGLDQRFYELHWRLLDAHIPIALNDSICGVVDGPGGPAALSFWHDEGDLMWSGVTFEHTWISMEIWTPSEYRESAAGEIAPGRFGVESTAADFELWVSLSAGLPSSAGEIETELRTYFKDAVGIDDLAEGIEWSEDGFGAGFRGSVAVRGGILEFSGSARGPGLDFIRSIAPHYEV